jgi:hypothetical protein
MKLLFLILATVTHSSQLVFTKQLPSPPTFTEIFGSSVINYTMKKDDLIRLPCVAYGYPKPAYEWRKNGALLTITPVSDGTIVIKGQGDSPPTAQDQGYYQCIASNPVGKAYSNVTFVRLVKAADFPKDDGTSIQKTPAVGSSLKISCSPSQLPIPMATNAGGKSEMTWEYAGEAKSLGNRVRIDDFGNLNIAYVTQDDDTSTKGGPIFCHMKSPLTGIEATGSSTEILVDNTNPLPRRKPTILFYSNQTLNPGDSTTVLAVEGRSVSLRCFFGGSDDIEIQWSKGTYLTPTSSDSSEYYIKNVKKTDEGEYTCTGSSAAGSTSFITNVIVQAAPVFENVNNRPHDMNVSVGEESTVYCKTYADPVADIKWFINGVQLDPNDENNKQKFSWSSDLTKMTLFRICKTNCTPNDNKAMVIQCNASNIHGYSYANGYINVFVPTRVTISTTFVELNLGDTCNVSAAATTDPDTTLTYRWYHVVNGERRLIVADSTYTLNSDNTSLQFNLDNRDIAGNYTVTASNGISSDSKFVIVALPPAAAYVWPYWWVILLILILLVLFIVIVCVVCCCIRQNRGDEYPVDEKEREAERNPEKELADSGFHDYQRTANSDIERQPLTAEPKY